MSDSFLHSENIKTENKSQPLSAHCKNCARFTLIEGEAICFKSGEIIQLHPIPNPKIKPALLCKSWQMIKK